MSIRGLLLFLCCSFSTFLSAQEYIIWVKSAYTGDGKVFTPGEIWVKDGKIFKIGSKLEKKKGITIINATDSFAMPGIVCAAGISGNGSVESHYSFNWDQLAVDGVDLVRPQLRLIRAGITTTYVAPGNIRMVNGFGSVIKTGGKNRLLRTKADLHLHLGSRTLQPPKLFKPPIPATAINPILPKEPQLPTSRIGVISCLRELFSLATTQPSLLELSEQEQKELLLSIQKGLPLRIQSEDSFYQHHAITLAKALNQNVLIERAMRVAFNEKELAQVPQILTIASSWISDIKRGKYKIQEREQFCLAPSSSNEAKLLLSEALNFQRVGWTAERCLSLITANPAKFLRVDSEVGTLAEGKDADLLLLNLKLEIDKVYIEGEEVYQRKKQTPPTFLKKQPNLFVLRRALLHTVSQGSFKGDLLIGNGKILGIGTQLQLPKGVPEINVRGKEIIPGFIDPFSSLGQNNNDEESGSRFYTVNQDLSNRSSLERCRLEAKAFQQVIPYGITSLGIALPKMGLLSGTGTVLKATGQKRIVGEHQFYLCSLTQGNPVQAGMQIQKFIGKARKYKQQRIDYQEQKKKYLAAIKKNPKQTALKKPPAIQINPAYKRFNQFEKTGGVLICEAQTVPQIKAALKYLKQNAKIEKLVLFPATEATYLATELAQNQVGILLNQLEYWKQGERHFRLLELQQAGIKASFASFASQANMRLNHQFQQSLQKGISPFSLLKSATLDAATLLGVEQRIGSLEVGKDADFLVLSGPPFQSQTQIEMVYINGKKINY